MAILATSSHYDMFLIEKIKKALLRNVHTVAVAESVTSGHLQAGLSLGNRAMQYFQGGITVYNLRQKARFFDIDPVHAIKCNCVSPKIADVLATGAARLFSSDWGIGITGYAVPDPEHKVAAPFAFYSFALHGKIISNGRLVSKEEDQLEGQTRYANLVFKALASVLEEGISK